MATNTGPATGVPAGDETAADADADGDGLGEGLLNGLAEGSGLATGAGLFTTPALLPDEILGVGDALGLGCLVAGADEVEPALPVAEALPFLASAFGLAFPLVELCGLFRRDALESRVPVLRLTSETVAPRTAERFGVDFDPVEYSRSSAGGVGPVASRIVRARVRFATSPRSARELAPADRDGIEKTISMRFNFWSMRAVVPGCR